MKKRILVFPCGSEIGLEIYRSMCYSAHFELVGASSVDDHGRFVFEEYIGGVPFHDDLAFPAAMKLIIDEHQIDAIYPAMDAVADSLKRLTDSLDVLIIGGSPEVTRICASKVSTYEALEGVVPLPVIFTDLSTVDQYPIFIKPDRGYGSRNICKASSREAALDFFSKFESSSMVILEYLPGEEWTVDCFTDRHGKLHFHAPRIRGRISNGISVYTKPSDLYADQFSQWASSINEVLRPRGAWFFQAKLDATGSPKLLEVASRLGGSSALFRCSGVNFALLSAFDAFDMDVEISLNRYQIEMDRALGSRFKITLEFKQVFVDLDDCLIIRGKVNLSLVSFLYKARSEGKTLNLITRHYREPIITLKEHRLSELFDKIIHLTSRDAKKSQYIDDVNSIFIDDSYTERKDVFDRNGIAVFSPDMIEALL